MRDLAGFLLRRNLAALLLLGVFVGYRITGATFPQPPPPPPRVEPLRCEDVSGDAVRHIGGGLQEEVSIRNARAVRSVNEDRYVVSAELRAPGRPPGQVARFVVDDIDAPDGAVSAADTATAEVSRYPPYEQWRIAQPGAWRAVLYAASDCVTPRPLSGHSLIPRRVQRP
jgi:hypothetical protein